MKQETWDIVQDIRKRKRRRANVAEQTIIIRYRDIGVLGAFAEEAEKIAG